MTKTRTKKNAYLHKGFAIVRDGRGWEIISSDGCGNADRLGGTETLAAAREFINDIIKENSLLVERENAVEEACDPHCGENCATCDKENG